jgi:Flp pilus assembly protein TadD
MDAAATALYLQALAEHPTFWRANVNLGYLYYREGNYSEAAQYFERACLSDPTDGNQFLYLGMSLLQLNQLPDAERAIRMAMVIRPQGKDYHTGLGLVLRQAGRLTEAKQEFETELRRDPNDARAKELLADVESKLSDQTKGPAPAR